MCDNEAQLKDLVAIEIDSIKLSLQETELQSLTITPTLKPPARHGSGKQGTGTHLVQN